MTKVFIIHGWTYTLDKWTELCEILRSQGFEVVQLRVPGLTVKSEEAWDIVRYTDWLRKELSDEIKPVVVGHSNGGRIGLNYANRYPEALGGLILIDSAGIYHGDLFSKTKRGVFKVTAKLGKPLASIPIAKKVFYRLIGVKDYYKAAPHMQQTMKNMLAADKTLDISNVTVPIQLIWGQKDKATPMADARKLQKILHNPPLEVIKGAGHSPHATHPEQVAQIITKAIEEKNT